MERIAIISDVHANITALNAVLKDIKQRKINRIFCLGDCVVKGVSPAEVIDILRENCEVILIGNTDYSICVEEAIKRKFWTTEKIGLERVKFLSNLPRMYQFYMSGQLIRLFHATPYSLDGLFNPMFKNDDLTRVITNPDDMFKNTEFLGLNKDDKEPDIVGYGHIHTPMIIKHKNRTIFNTGSVGSPVEMGLTDTEMDENKFSTVASYMILEGDYNSKIHSNISFTQVRVIYDIEKEIELLKKSDMPGKTKNIKILKTAISSNQ